MYNTQNFLNFALQNRFTMQETTIKPLGKTRISVRLPFEPRRKQVFYYDPQGNSPVSQEIGERVSEIMAFFADEGYEFCFFPEIAKRITEDCVRYRFPAWNGEPLNEVGNDALKPYITEEDQDIGPCFIHFSGTDEFNCFNLYNTETYPLDTQLAYYRENLAQADKDSDGDIRFSVAREDKNLYQACEKKLVLADELFETDSAKLSKEIMAMVESLHQQGVGEVVLRCMVPVKDKLSRVVITPNYDIMLPDYGSEPIEMSPLPKALFLLFLRHEEGIFFKDLVDYREELKAIYTKLTNRVSATVVTRSLDSITDPTNNAVNEKCSRIREAFVKRMDERVAQHYFITGSKGDVKRIILPRDLVEWECEI